MKQKKQKPNNSLSLGNPHVIVSKSPFITQFLFYFFILLLGISSAYGCFYTAFAVPISLGIVIACTVLFCSAFTTLFLVKRRSIRRLFLLAVCLSTMLFLNDSLRNNLIQGFIRTINTVILGYAKKENFDFITLPVSPSNVNEITMACTTFAVSILFLITLFMAWLLIRRKNTFLCFLLTIPFLAASLAFTIIPNDAAVTGILIFWTFLLLNSSLLRRKNRFFKKKRVFYGSGNVAVHPASFIIIPILIICMILISFLFPMQGFQRLNVVEDLRTGLTSRPDISSLFRHGGVGGNISRVNLQSVGNLEFTGKIILRVKSSKRNTEYLKGFVGSVYTGHSWEALTEKNYQELDQILDGYNVQNFPFLFTNLLHYGIDGNLNNYDLTVQNVGGNPRNIYTPYGLISEPKDLPDIDFVNDGFLISGNSVFGTEEYSMKAFNIQQAQEQGAPKYRSTLSSSQALFAKTAQEYMEFVYAHYTQLPEELKDKLSQYREDHSLNTEHYPSSLLLADAITKQVHSENSYTLSPGVTPEGRDFVEYFLFENHKGYCMHFASATVVLLRSAGIPARYVEGYTISEDDFTTPDGWTDIPDSRAHAWVEIYLDGVGWVPVEATPSAANAAISPEISQTTENENESESSTESSEESTTQKSSEEISSEPQISDENDNSGTSSGRSENFIINILPQILSVIVVIGLLLLFLWTRRKLCIRLRNKKFRQEDTNKAAIAIYDYILKLLPYTKSAPHFTGEVPDNLYELVLKARFSQHILTEQEVDKLLDYSVEMADQMREKVSIFHRFVYKYIYVLF